VLDRKGWMWLDPVYPAGCPMSHGVLAAVVAAVQASMFVGYCLLLCQGDAPTLQGGLVANRRVVPWCWERLRAVQLAAVVPGARALVVAAPDTPAGW
jgi:hypothetical protein